MFNYSMSRLYYITSNIEKAKENLEAEQEKQHEDYNPKHANPSVYALGAKVLVKRRKREGKWTIVGLVPTAS